MKEPSKGIIMKTHLQAAFVLAFLISVPALAQQWCAPGAHWSHTYFMPGAPDSAPSGVILSHYTGDTLINGQLTQKIESRIRSHAGQGPYTETSLSTRYTYVGGGVVWQWRSGQNTSDTLLWFGASVGDRWEPAFYTSEPDFEIFHEVMAVDTVDVEGTPLRRLAVTYNLTAAGQVWSSTADTLIERIGFLHADLFNPDILVDSYISSFLCYGDDDLSFTRPGIDDCGYTLDVPEAEASMALQVFPNPGTSYLSLGVPLENGPFALLVRDAIGRVVMDVSLPPGRQMVETAGLPSGIYMLELRSVRARHVVRWVKE